MKSKKTGKGGVKNWIYQSFYEISEERMQKSN